MSLLMWECGLKQQRKKGQSLTSLSLLMWECGLKQNYVLGQMEGGRVTPYVGVWIETRHK